MARLPGIPLTFRARGLSDAIDGSNAFPGAMQQLVNLIPAPHTQNMFVPRPAAVSVTTFGSGFTSPAQIEALLVVGAYAYGFIASSDYAGKSVPFCYNLFSGAFQPISIPRGAAALPATAATAGDWTPPTIAVVGSRVLFTHPGFPGGATKFGWLDISGFSDTTHTGTVANGSPNVSGLSANVLQAGWQPGMKISGANIPANTTILSIASNGTSLVMSQNATGSGAAEALTVTGGTQAAPLWDAGDTNLNNLAAVPVAVANFNGRAYFAVPGAGMAFSDSGVPCSRTNASQALTPQNGLNVTAFGGLPVTQSQGGILQALIGFQGSSGMIQVTGDAALGNLALNNLGVGVGCVAPNTICQTPLGLMFVAPDGVRYVDLLARVSDPIGAYGQGVQVPFLNAINPSRMAAAYNQGVYRVSVQNGAAAGQPVQDYWFDLSLKIWTGPHSFPAAFLQPFEAATGAVTGRGFIMVASGINAALWESDVTPTANSSYTENGSALTWLWQPCLMPDNAEMCENAVVETTLAMALSANAQMTATATDEAGTPLGSVTLTGSGKAPSLWGSFVWGHAPWDGYTGYLRQYQLPWSQPLVFKQMTIQLNGFSVAGLAIGNLMMRYQKLDYLMQASGGRI